MKKVLFLFTISILLTGCEKEKNKKLLVDQQITAEQSKMDLKGYELLKTKCYICHNPNSVSHDNLIAPPMVAVKKRYKMLFDTKESFVEAVTNWSVDPEEKKALMRGAVMQFKVMPKQAFKAEEMEIIAAYMFDNELERPEWFEAHEKEIHGQNGRGMGRGMRNNSQKK